MKSLQGVSANRECFLIIDQQISMKTKQEVPLPDQIATKVHFQIKKEPRSIPQSSEEIALHEKKAKDILQFSIRQDLAETKSSWTTLRF